MRAMLLAAGLGTRMRPLTGTLAKPALPVLDEPLVLRMARALASQGIDRIVVNTHANAESVRAALRASPVPVSFSHEARLRGSGGGVLGARRDLEGPEPFLVVNADMVVDVDVGALLGAHRAHGGSVTLLLREDPRQERFGSLGFDSHGRLCRIVDRVRTGDETGSGLFTGVHVMESSIFDRMPAVESFDSVRDLYVPLLREGATIGTLLQPREARWWPVGTPGELLEANLRALNERFEGAGSSGVHRGEESHVEGKLVAPVWIGAGARVEAGARVGPEAVVSRGARIERGARLERAMVLPGTRVPSQTVLAEGIMGAEGMWSRG